ncbi:sulfotransferase [Rubellimicrobium sp. CFH 75288]|uniref:sulfotransferase n=1 Tax=Rubellimicrobium sp. CFH 75288 TaxID=2697034 RepID=UPI001412D0A7|nr:sulfotransferase [Rubellimicrobium sp. CFH 75288]NAZ38172.1 hypothetical protein [Rubellimicrobium sp. CFH 75288]
MSPAPSRPTRPARRGQTRGPKVRLLHHFARTGGTILSRAIAAQPGVMLLSEIDPFAEPKPHFAPSDLIRHARLSPDGLSDAATAAMVRAAIRALVTHLEAEGRHLVIRVHSHGAFCTGAAVRSGPDVTDCLAPRFRLREAVSVRHPLHSFRSLAARNWLHFTPPTLEEYARRYHAFLDRQIGLPLFFHERFVQDPDAVLERIATVLHLPFDPGWRARLGQIVIPGDPDQADAPPVETAPARTIPAALARQAAQSSSYARLCARLGYDPSPEADPLPRRSRGATDRVVPAAEIP